MKVQMTSTIWLIVAHLKKLKLAFICSSQSQANVFVGRRPFADLPGEPLRGFFKIGGPFSRDPLAGIVQALCSGRAPTIGIVQALCWGRAPTIYQVLPAGQFCRNKSTTPSLRDVRG